MNLFNNNLGVRLSVAADGLGVLLRAILEDDDLLGLAVLQHLGFDRSACHHGSAELRVLAVHDCQHLIEGYGCVSLGAELLDIDDVAFLDAVLLATGNDNCLHSVCTYLFCSLALEV